MTLRILMVNYEYPPIGGGSANATHYLLRELALRPDLSIDLVTCGTGSRPEIESLTPSIRIHHVPVPKKEMHFWTARELGTWFLRARAYCDDLIEREAFDLGHYWSGWPSGIIGHRYRKRIPYLVSLRGSDVPGYNPRLRALDPVLFKPIARAVWKGATAVTCVSENLGALARKTMPDLRFEVVRNAVDCERFRPGTPDKAFTAIFAGRLIERKGVTYLFRALRLLADDGRICHLLVAGSGPERQRMERYALDNGLRGQVEFHGVVGDELPALYRRAHVFVLPALEEALSNAALEAIATGLPLITTRTGVEEILDDNGLLIRRKSAESIAEAIGRYIDDPDLLATHAGRSRALAESMPWSAVADRYVAIYNGMRKAGAR
ncbi:MAG: glycosyltransferase family 4 protein [Gemmatimonadetes bacterium]|nr:glycosyltransferase family 4 protein [Gemmatimonadota bacterium]